MNSISNFDFLLIGHLLGDFALQTGWMAKNKVQHWLPLLVHSLLYTAVISVIAYLSFGGLSIAGTGLIFVAHVAADRRTIIRWWVTHVMRSGEQEATWLSIVVDQVFHLTILAVVLTFLG